MGFKLPGKSITSGTSAHSSALKQVEPKMADKDWKKGQESAKSAGWDLDALVKKRGGLKKGSDEYNIVQNHINKALGSKKIHGKTKTTLTKGKTKTTKKVTPGLSTTDYETKTKRGGKVKVTKKRHEDDMGITTKKTRSKYDKEGKAIKHKTVAKTDWDKDKKVDKKTKLITNVKKGTEKKVVREGGRRTVTKTKDGVTTTKSRRTFKGWLTGKGKKKK